MACGIIGNHSPRIYRFAKMDRPHAHEHPNYRMMYLNPDMSRHVSLSAIQHIFDAMHISVWVHTECYCSTYINHLYLFRHLSLPTDLTTKRLLRSLPIYILFPRELGDVVDEYYRCFSRCKHLHCKQNISETNQEYFIIIWCIYLTP